MSASANPDRPALVRVGTLLDVLARRVRSPAEGAAQARLQAAAEESLLALLTSLGEFDEQPLRSALLAEGRVEAAE